VQLAIVLAEGSVKRFFTSTTSGSAIKPLLSQLPSKLAYAIACVPAIGQTHVLKVVRADSLESIFEDLRRLGEALAHVEEFYDSIGGLPGYQLQCLMQIEAQQRLASCNASTTTDNHSQESMLDLLVPSGLDLQSEAAQSAVAAGISGIPYSAEIYPLGGAGDRLGLQCEETGDSLPTAVLPYCGRSLLENLIRDLQAREYLYYRLYGQQHTTPVAVMTSAAKGNHARVYQLFEAAHWFGRGRDAFMLFQQPLVPMVAAADGKWLATGPLQLMMKPGGHGVIWKLMLDRGVFSWLANNGRSAAIVRQISNPMAGQDTTLLALAGEGIRGDRAFGFASCERVVGAAEGVNVLLRELEREGRGSDLSPDTRSLGGNRTTSSATYRISNVEYTEFSRLGIEDRCAGDGSQFSLFPANTNVLYVGLPAAEYAVREGVSAGTTDAILPGMILNLQKEACYVDAASGNECRVPAGRLECTMQNLADCFATEVEVPATNLSADGDGDGLPPPDALSTFMVYGPRRKVTSSAKRKRTPGSTKIHQTPDGSLLDLQHNAADMLAKCGMTTPSLGSVEQYLDRGPEFLFLFHPALGPLWDVVAQKIRGGALAPRSEVQLEVAEVSIEDLHVDGSLLVLADSVMGRMYIKGNTHARQNPHHRHHHHHNNHNHNNNAHANKTDARLVFGDACGRVRLRNVRVKNEGVDWDSQHNVYWRHRVVRKESCKIVLHGSAEFEACDVELKGDLEYVVPDGHRLVVAAGPDGEPVSTLEPMEDASRRPSWRWDYSI